MVLCAAAGAYANLVKLQMQQQAQQVEQNAEVEEVLAADGRPVTRDSVEQLSARQVRRLLTATYLV